jgi:hypothetical protein
MYNGYLKWQCIMECTMWLLNEYQKDMNHGDNVKEKKWGSNIFIMVKYYVELMFHGNNCWWWLYTMLMHHSLYNIY